jgi:hypothetical protein
MISDGKQPNIEELELKMNKAKELGKNNEGKDLKKKSDDETFKDYRKKMNDKINEAKEETLQHVKKRREKKEVQKKN